MKTFTFTKLFLSGILEGLTVQDSFTADALFESEYTALVGTERKSFTGALYRVLAVTVA